MAVMSAIFKGVDEISNVLDKMANSGAAATEQWESAGNVADHAFSQATTGAESLAQATQQATAATDYWTNALGNYDKIAMEAIHTTEDLVDMGFKTEESLSAAAAAAGEQLDAIEKGTRVADEFSAAIKEQEQELERLQNAYIGVALNMGQSSEEATALKGEINELSKVLDQNKEEWNDLEKASGKAGETGPNAIEAIEQALIAAGLTKLLSEASEAVVTLTNDFSEAESVIVKATGATAEQLDSLSASMKNVYSNVDDADMNNTAAAIGEINTRLHLQGEELDNVATLFMTYADNTNSNVVPAIQSVTKVMKNWDVGVSGTELLLDKLRLPANSAGASVDYLSSMVYSNKAILDQLDYGLNESIALFAMFEYEGLDATAMMTGFRTAIAKFTNDGRDASVALRETIEQLANMEDRSAATALAVDIFGSRAGSKLADAIQNGRFEIEEWVAALEGSQGTLARTDAAADTLADKWTQSSNSMKTAFTDVIEPVTSGASETFAELYGNMGEFLNEHPAVTAGLVGIATSLGLAAAGVAAFSAALAIKTAILPIATALTATFGVTLSAAIWPITLVVAGVAALVAGVTLLVGWIDKTNKEYNDLTAVSKQHHDQLSELNREYEQTVAVVGENDEAARKLRGEIILLEEEYSRTKKTLEQFTAECDALVKAHDKIVSTYSEATTAIKSEELGTLALISKLEELSSQTQSAGDNQQQMEAIIGRLNERLPGLALSYEQVTDSLDSSVKSLRAFAEAEVEQRRLSAQNEAYLDAYERQAELVDKIAEAEANLAAERARLADHWYYGDQELEDAPFYQWTTDVDEYKNALAELQATLAENEAIIAETEQAYREYEEAARATAAATVEWDIAVHNAVLSVSDDLNKLIEDYDRAYEAAYSSISGQYELWDKAAAVVATSAATINSAMESQIDYWQKYNANLSGLSERSADIAGLSDMIASFADGSEQSVNAIAGMSNATDEELQAMVANWQSLQEEHKAVSSSIAQMETDFDNSMSEIESRMTEAIDNMNMSSEASQQASATIDAYVRAIEAGIGRAQSAAEAVANATASALGGSGVSTVGLPGVAVVPAHASGTTNGEDVFIAGDGGPELIVGMGGSTVFPADETSKILAAMNDRPINAPAPAGFMGTDSATSRSVGGGEVDTSGRVITVKFEGGEAIRIDKNANKETILDVLMENARPVLMGILQQEIFEEGNLSYEF